MAGVAGSISCEAKASGTEGGGQRERADGEDADSGRTRRVDGRLECTRSTDQPVWRLEQVIWETRLLILCAPLRLAKEGHAESLHRVE
jgi:hypothetical protein